MLVGHKSDLQAAVSPRERSSTACAKKDLPGHSLYLRAINAYKWSKKIPVSDIGSGPKLLLTPTVRLELMMAPMVSTSIILLCLHFDTSSLFIIYGIKAKIVSESTTFKSKILVNKLSI